MSMSHSFSQSKDQGIFETFKGRVSSFIVRRENKTTLQLYASEALSISSTDTHCLLCILAACNIKIEYFLHRSTLLSSLTRHKSAKSLDDVMNFLCLKKFLSHAVCLDKWK